MTTEEIKEFTEQYFDIDISTRTREHKYIKIRFLYCHYAYYYSSRKTSEKYIGSLIDRDRTSVIYALKEYPNIVRFDIEFKSELSSFHKAFLEKLDKTVPEEYKDLVPESIDKLELKKEIKLLREKVKRRDNSIKNIKHKYAIKKMQVNRMKRSIQTRDKKIKSLLQ